MGATWICSDCEVENDLDEEVEVSQTVTCEECSAEYQVLDLEPLEIEPLELPETSGVGDADDADDDWD